MPYQILRNKEIQPGRKVFNTWLAGKIKCGICGYALTRKWYASRKYSYFYCSHKRNTSNGCVGSGTIYGEKLEEDVFRRIVNKLSEFVALTDSSTATANPKLAGLQAELAQVEREIEEIINSFSSFSQSVLSYINNRVSALDIRKQELVEAIKEISASALDADKIAEMRGYLTKWDGLSLDDKRHVCNLLIKKVRATESEVLIEWNF